MPVNYADILKKIDQAVKRFNQKIPGIQKQMLQGVLDELRRLDLKNGNIKATVQNLKVLTSIKNKLNRIILTDDYLKDVKEFAKQFTEITKLQNEYWQSVEKTFKPKPLLKEIRRQAISDTVLKLTEAGIGVNVGDKITDILRANITSGGSYKSLESQLRESMTNTKTDGSLLKYTKQITVDAINQYNAQYTQIVSSDLGFEFFAYQGTEIETSRPFCQSMVEENKFFHISEVPRLLKAENMYYTDNKDGERKEVPIYERTKLPHGFIEGTNPENFFIRRGGYRCGHQIRPVSASLVPNDIKERIFATAAYKRRASLNV